MPASLSMLTSLARAVRHRREVLALADLDPDLLRDIGLRHADIHRALAQPLHRDPSRMLKEACCQGFIPMHGLRGPRAPEPIPCC